MAEIRANWNYPTSVRFGAGRIKELSDVLESLNIRNPLFVTDPGLADLPMTKSILEELRGKGLGVKVFSDFKPNPIGKNVEDGVKAFNEGKHDGTIAFGGGSALDVGKAIAFMAGQSRPIWDFEDIGDNFKRADTSKLLPVVAIPTTTGTGSEVGRASVITNEESHKKTIIFHPRMLPNVVISDPELTLALPAKLTAWTGMDALAHNIEAVCAPGFHPMADGIAIEGIRLIMKWLPIAVHEGKNIEARANMLAAASMGAAAFQKGLGAIHSLSHPIGAVYDTHHGLTNAVVMPYVLDYNRESIEDILARVAAYIGLPNPSFDSFMYAVLKLRESIEIPHTLEELGVPSDKFEELSEMAEADPSTSGNPRNVNASDMLTMFKNSFEGKLSVTPKLHETA